MTLNQASGQADPTTTAPISFTAVFDKAVTGITGADISLAGSTAPGTLVARVTGGPSTYNVSVSGMTGPGLVQASIPANVVDGGNLASTSTDNTVTYSAPSVTINQAQGQPDPTTSSPVRFTVVFSRAVTGFTGSDINLAGSKAPGALAATVTSSGTTTRSRCPG